MKSIIHKIKKIKFKKVHYFDLLVILAVSSVIAIFLFNRVSKKSIWINARVLISDSELWWGNEPSKYWFIEELEVGDVSYNSFGEKVAEVVDIESFDLGGPNKQSFVDLKLKVSYDKKRQIYLYNFSPTQKGKPLSLTFGSNHINGLIVSLGSDWEERFTKKVRARIQYIDTWLANSYEVGMEMRDSRGRMLARIDEVEVSKSNLDRVTLLDGKIYKIREDLSDIDMVITMRALKSNEGHYRFVDGSSIKIGDNVWFHFPDIVAGAQIVEILE